jgi:beta-galactosidase
LSRFPAAPRRAAALLLAAAALAASARESQRLDTGWSFNLGEAAGASAPGFDATAWRPVTLPHDWSVALPLDPAAPSSGHGGFFQNGVGWYRRVITAPAAWADRRVELEFEGIYGLAEVWLNGVALGRHVYGYTPLQLDLTARLKLGADNVLAVRVDHSAQPSARWYTGSGLYRPVWLHVTDPVHVVADSVTVTTTGLEAARATVLFQAKVRNESSAPSKVTVETVLLDAEGRAAASFRKETTIAAGAVYAAESELTIARPEAWAPDSPSLYRAVTLVLQG